MGELKVSAEWVKNYELMMKRIYSDKYKDKHIDYNTEQWVSDNSKEKTIYMTRKQLKKYNKEKKRTSPNYEKNKYNIEYKKVRPYVLERDNYKCVMCGCNEELQIHHIIERKDGGTNNINNLQTLCMICHSEKHKHESVYKLMKKRIRNKINNA